MTVAEKISRHARIATQYVDIPVEAQRKAMMDQGMPDWQVTALLELQEYYTGWKLRNVGRSPGGIARTASDRHGSIPGRICGRVPRPGGEGLTRGAMEPINVKTGMRDAEAEEFIRNHFEEFVNNKDVQIGNVNFAADFVEHGADVPPGTPPGPAGAIQ